MRTIELLKELEKLPRQERIYVIEKSHIAEERFVKLLGKISEQ